MVKEDIITGEDGTAFIEGLEAGDYIVTEITAPGGYLIDSNPHPVSLEEGKTYTLTLGEHPPAGFADQEDRQPDEEAAAGRGVQDHARGRLGCA